jgi:hypothetical protein
MRERNLITDDNLPCSNRTVTETAINSFCAPWWTSPWTLVIQWRRSFKSLIAFRLFGHEEEGIMVLRNVCNDLPVDTTSHPWTLAPSTTPLGGFHEAQNVLVNILSSQLESSAQLPQNTVIITRLLWVLSWKSARISLITIQSAYLPLKYFVWLFKILFLCRNYMQAKISNLHLIIYGDFFFQCVNNSTFL